MAVRRPVGFSDSIEEFLFTSLPVAVSSWVLESIGFTEIVNTSVQWDPVQSKVSPGDAMKAMVLTMSMGPERPALENIAGRFEHEPLALYFSSVSDRRDLDPDMFARNLTRVHEADEDRVFMNTSAAIRTHFGIKSRAIHSDTSSVAVYGEYDCYDREGNGYVLGTDGARHPEPDVLYITKGYSKDRRPDLDQYMLGDAVDDNGIPWMSRVLDGNTPDSEWNRRCLEVLKDVLVAEGMVYVADSKVVNDPLVTMMVEDGVMFVSRCPSNFDDSLLERTLMAFDPDDLIPIPNISPRRDAATRRVCSRPVEFRGHVLRAVIVETSTLMGNGEKAVRKAEESFLASLGSLRREFNCRPDAEKAFADFAKRHSRGIFRLTAHYDHRVVERRPRGRPRKDGTDVRRMDVWMLDVGYEMDEVRAEALRRRKGYIMLLSNVPTPEQDARNGLDDADLVRLYANEWRVEWNFKGKKRPVMVERLFMKDVGRAEALITMVNIAALVRATVQLLLRRGIDRLLEDHPEIASRMTAQQRKMTYDYFMEDCRRCMIRYDPLLGQCRYMGNADDEKASMYLSLMGIPKDRLFTGGI